MLVNCVLLPVMPFTFVLVVLLTAAIHELGLTWSLCIPFAISSMISANFGVMAMLHWFCDTYSKEERFAAKMVSIFFGLISTVIAIYGLGG